MEALRRGIESVDLETRRDAFFDEMRHEIDNPRGTEPVVEAFYQASLIVNTLLPAYGRLTDGYLEREKVGSPSYQLNKYFKAHQFIFLKDDNKLRYQYGYPENFDDVSTWIDYLVENYTDPENPVYANTAEALAKPLQVNRRLRNKVPAFVAAALAHDRSLDDEPKVFCEIGSAGDLVMRAYAVREFSDTVIVDSSGNEDRRQTIMFNEYVHTAPPVQEAICIEKNPPENDEDYDWIKACTLDPSKLDSLDPRGMHEDHHDLATAIRPAVVKTIKRNALRLTVADLKYLKNRVDVAFLSHTAPQIKNFGGLMDLIDFMLKPDGVGVANEYATANYKDPRKLQLLHRWYREAWLCQSHIYLPADKPPGWLPIIEWERADCERGRFVGENIGRLAPVFA